jgi:hypothetical protein
MSLTSMGSTSEDYISESHIAFNSTATTQQS